MLTPSMEDYLKAIYLLEQKHGNASTSMLAEEMGFSAASVTGMIKKLAMLDMVEYEPYRGVRLTPVGQQAALETLRHHRLLELFLTEKLGFSWDEVHEEADRLEHHISEALEARIFELLGEPTHDPHGDPIPTLSGDLPKLELHSLTELKEGDIGVIARVLTRDDEVLRYLREVGLGLNVAVEVLDLNNVGGTIALRVEGERDVTISTEVGERIKIVHRVEPGREKEGP
ncbi:MAG: metal-dependent transcriptional regulator [Chloroflexota bacterium]|nr:metal-dependent transcriptional regulator [Chloroflexota bacterium]